jgi:hypothetical protein
MAAGAGQASPSNTLNDKRQRLPIGVDSADRPSYIGTAFILRAIHGEV